LQFDLDARAECPSNGEILQPYPLSNFIRVRICSNILIHVTAGTRWGRVKRVDRREGTVRQYPKICRGE